jgi:hypothetical protein
MTTWIDDKIFTKNGKIIFFSFSREKVYKVAVIYGLKIIVKSI